MPKKETSEEATEETPEAAQPEEPTTDIALTPGAALARLKEKLVPESRGFNPMPVLIKIIHPVQMFDVPGIKQEKRMVGVILASKMGRILYPRFSDDSVGEAIINITSKRPFCSSGDYETGQLVDLTESDWSKAPEEAGLLKEKIAEGAGRCFDCPLREWGSEEIFGRGGRGTACKELRRLLWWMPGLTIPCLLTFPQSSVRNVDSYLSGLLAGELSAFEVVTEISLDPRERGDRKWSVGTFDRQRELPEEWAIELVQPVIMKGRRVSLFEGLVAIFNEREIGLDEYENNGTPAGGDDF